MFFVHVLVEENVRLLENGKSFAQVSARLACDGFDEFLVVVFQVLAAAVGQIAFREESDEENGYCGRENKSPEKGGSQTRGFPHGLNYFLLNCPFSMVKGKCSLSTSPYWSK